MRFRTLPAALLALELWCVPSLVCAEEVRAASDPAPRGVLFVLGAGDEKVATPDALRAAVEAQLAGTSTRVTFVRFAGEPTTLREQVREARTMMASGGAAGIFWLETAESGEWLLYLAEPDAERILVRRLEVESASAGTEVVGVITGRSAEALASGQTIGMQPVDLAAPKSLETGRELSPFEPLPEVPARGSSPDETPEPNSGPRLAVGYRGSTYSEQLSYQHGLSFAAYWVLRHGPIAGLELTTYSAAESKSELVTLQIARTGGAVQVGWRFPLDPFALEVELGYQGELVRRSVLATVGDIPKQGPLSRWQSAVGGVVRGDVAVTRALGVFAGVGGHFVLNDFESIALVDGERSAVSTPFSLRVSARVGLLLWP